MKLLLIIFLVLPILSHAEPDDQKQLFEQGAALPVFIQSIPTQRIDVTGLKKYEVVRYREEQIKNESTMPEIRERFEAWCKAQTGTIVQPYKKNCAPLNDYYSGCAKGEVQYDGMDSDLELALKDIAKNNNFNISMQWPKASWLISGTDNTFAQIFLSEGKKRSIVGGLQRCIARNNSIIAAMVFVSIDKNNDLLFLSQSDYDDLIKSGSIIKKNFIENAKADKEKRIKEYAASLKTGDSVRHYISGRRGLVIETRPPLVQVQWAEGYAYTAEVEWVKAEVIQRIR